MTRANTVRAVLALAVLAVSGWLVATRPPNLGLDLRGGTQIVLETRDGELAKANADTTDEALEVLRRRVDQLGVSEPVAGPLRRAPDHRRTARRDRPRGGRRGHRHAPPSSTFHPVLGLADPAAGSATTLIDEDGRDTLELGPAAIDGAADRRGAAPSPASSAAGPSTSSSAAAAPAPGRTLTGEAACAPVGDPTRRVAIVLDGKIISSPQVNPDIACDVGITGGRTSITGSFTADRGEGPGAADPRRRAAGAGGDHRAADRRPEPGRRRDRGVGAGGRASG